MIKDLIEAKLKLAVIKTGVKNTKVEVDYPTNPTFGDYACSIALKLSKQLKKNPMLIAQEITDNIKTDDAIGKITVIKPGFINFFITQKVLTEELYRVVKYGSKYGNQKSNNKKVIVEFGQPNTHKLPHVGHLFSYIYGESLARMLETNGYKVFRANYQGDVGLHVAKCLYALSKSNEDFFLLKKEIKNRAYLLQKYYQKGSTLYETNPTAKKEIDLLNQQIYEKNPKVFKLWQETRKASLDFYHTIEEKIGVHYNRSFFESETAEEGKRIVLKNISKIFEKSEQAIVFKGEKYGLHTRVFINKYGYPTYEAKDVGLISLKKRLIPFDLSLVTTANEQNEYWKVIIKVSELLYPELVGKLKHIGFGMINLTSGKMSSRTGQIVNADSLIFIVGNEIKKTFAIKNNDELCLKIAVAAIKYSFLNGEATRNVTFDINKSIAKEGNSGPYLLYTYVRCQSVLNKEKNKLSISKLPMMNPEEEALTKKIYQYSEMVEKATTGFIPHIIATYLYDLAQKFNFFYQKNPILKAEKGKKQLRLLLTKATAQIIKNGLYLLGIETVDKM